MKYYFFDLDGTVTESAEGILNSVAYALEKLGRPVADKSTLRRFIGPPLSDSFREFYNFDEETIRQGVAYYREYYPKKGIFENKLYDGIDDLLKKLSEKNAKIILATSKPEIFAVRILEHFGISRYFDLIAGSTLDVTRSDKASVLRYAIEKIGLSDLDSALMVGDRKHDVLGAHEVGMRCAYVLYGYGNEAEAKEYNADIIVDSMEALSKLLLMT